MKKILTILFLFFTIVASAQQIKITGVITDQATKQPIEGAAITIKDKLAGTVTDSKGNFTLTVNKIKLPFSIIISSVNHAQQEIEIKENNPSLTIELKQKNNVLDEIVVAPTRIPENILRSPVSIEKMNLKTIQENPSLSFYDGLQNLKGMEVVTSSLTYKQVNTRGFNNTGNGRFLQLVDGVDNQTPGLNFAVGNQFGAADIDMESAEVIPGAASALYGPVAFNGALLMHTKDPFKYQGLSVQLKTGINHIGEDIAKPQGLYDIAARYAKAFNNKFAFKLNAAYVAGLDWYGTNYTDVSAQTSAANRGPNNPGRDALNIYGDEVSRTLTGIGLVTRTGYEEKDLMNYNVYSIKLNGALHYRINNNLELIYQYKFGKGTASYTGSSRFDLNNFVLQTNRLELKGSNFFLRSYVVAENSQNSYNTRSLAQFINRDWVKDLAGNVVAANQADAMWFTRYQSAYNGTVNGVTAASHIAARTFADQGRFAPGTEAFNQAKQKSVSTFGINGAGVFSNSKFYHTEGQYDFTKMVKVVELLAGGHFRMYDMFTDGSLFDDKNQKITIKETGAFMQASKKLVQEKLKLTASIRYDKNQNFAGNFTPRFAAVYTANKVHNFRASFQTGFRNPTPVDQFIKLNVGPITILGGAPANSKGMNVYENSFTAASVGAFGAAFGQAMQSGTAFPTAVNNNKALLQKSNVDYVKPEQQRSFEIGYKGLIKNKLMIDVNYYRSSYKNFIINTVVIRPDNPLLAADGTISFNAAADIPNGTIKAFQLYTNAADEVVAQGASMGLTYILQKGYSLGGNLTFAEFNLKDANPNNIPAFNTPKYSSNVTFGNSNAYKNFGFNIAWHWQDAFDWYGTFNGLRPGRINAYSLVDVQVNKKLLKAKAMVKAGASNIFNHQVYQTFGSPAIGAIYYLSLTFDNLLKQ
jgi:iron complex outermembrane recepter protein